MDFSSALTNVLVTAIVVSLVGTCPNNRLSPSVVFLSAGAFAIIITVFISSLLCKNLFKVLPCMFFYAYSVPARLLLVRILLQFPEGLKKEALSHAIQYRKEGHEVFLSASPCYGACDLAYAEAEAVKA